MKKYCFNSILDIELESSWFYSASVNTVLASFNYKKVEINN